MPNTASVTWSNGAVDPCINADDAMASMIDVPIVASTTLAAGTMVGKVTATAKYAAYASGNSDGTQIPVGILRRAVTTDASGNITNWDEWGGTFSVAPIFLSGIFRLADLVGLDANAVTALKARLDGATIAASNVLILGN